MVPFVLFLSNSEGRKTESTIKTGPQDWESNLKIQSHCQLGNSRDHRKSQLQIICKDHSQLLKKHVFLVKS